VRAAPATGFPIGATCADRVQGADVVMIDGPDKLAPGARAKFSITVNNTGNVDWSANTKIVVSGGGTSELYDPTMWMSASEIGTIGSDIGAGAQGVIEIPVLAPMVTEETPVFTQLSLQDGGAPMGTINLAVTITPNGDEDTSGDSGDQNDDPDGMSGGCNAGGAGGWLAMFAPALLVLRRRRR